MNKRGFNPHLLQEKAPLVFAKHEKLFHYSVTKMHYFCVLRLITRIIDC